MSRGNREQEAFREESKRRRQQVTAQWRALKNALRPDTKGMQRLREMKARLRVRWPRRWVGRCGTEFVLDPGMPSNTGRCDACRGARAGVAP